jgi:hypothetical protein
MNTLTIYGSKRNETKTEAGQKTFVTQMEGNRTALTYNNKYFFFSFFFFFFFFFSRVSSIIIISPLLALTHHKLFYHIFV